jgi:hypothetical protein
VVQLPGAFASYLVRTAYSDEASWHAVRDAVLSDANEYGYLPDLFVVDDPAYDGLGASEVAAAVAPDHISSFVVVVDADALSDPAQAVLVVDLRTDVAPFRCLPRAVAEISSNQSISNVNLSEFARSVDASGVFRGFWEDPPGAAPEVANTL